MLDFILGNNVITIVLIIALAFVAISLLTLFAKYEVIRWLVCTPLFIVLVLAGIYSYGHINNYYSATGGIHGKLTDLIDTNKTHTKVEDNKLTYSFENFQMQKDSKGYYAVEKNENAALLDKNSTYLAYVNGYPCEIVNIVVGDDDARFIYRFSYVFADYDNDGKIVPIADDTIQIEFTFLKSTTNVKIKTNCSDEVYGLWNSYFNKNNFEITLEKTTEEVENKQELATITLLLDDNTYSVIKVKKGANYVLPTNITKDGYIFSGWTCNGEKVTILKNIQEDKTVSAELIFNLSVRDTQFYIFDALGMKFGTFETYKELDELEFYKRFFSGVYMDSEEHSLDYYKTTIAEDFKLNVDENSPFIDYLEGLYFKIKK